MMDAAYLHLITKHIAMIGVPFAVFLLLLGLWCRSDELKKAAFLSFIFLGSAAAATFLFGHCGGDFVEESAGENHETFAAIAFAAIVLTALTALFALLRYQDFPVLSRPAAGKEKTNTGKTSAGPVSRYPNRVVIAVLLPALASAAVLGCTGKPGGKIRPSEFNDRAPVAGEDKNGKRRDRNLSKPEKIPPVAENETPPENGGRRDRGGQR